MPLGMCIGPHPALQPGQNMDGDLAGVVFLSLRLGHRRMGRARKGFSDSQSKYYAARPPLGARLRRNVYVASMLPLPLTAPPQHEIFCPACNKFQPVADTWPTLVCGCCQSVVARQTLAGKLYCEQCGGWRTWRREGPDLICEYHC